MNQKWSLPLGQLPSWSLQSSLAFDRLTLTNQWGILYYVQYSTTIARFQSPICHILAISHQRKTLLLARSISWHANRATGLVVALAPTRAADRQGPQADVVYSRTSQSNSLDGRVIVQVAMPH